MWAPSNGLMNEDYKGNEMHVHSWTCRVDIDLYCDIGYMMCDYLKVYIKATMMYFRIKDFI